MLDLTPSFDDHAWSFQDIAEENSPQHSPPTTGTPIPTPHHQHQTTANNESSMTASSNHITPDFYVEEGVWRTPDGDGEDHFSARRVDPESASEDEGEGDLSEEEEMSDDEDTQSLDEDGIEVEPWQRGMSAIDALTEEFEREMARTGMYRHHCR